MQDKDGSIHIRGAREHHLKNLHLDIPLRAMTVVTGPSGSGKSTLAINTLYAEGQRRYVETFSPYVRQFMDRMSRPAVDAVENVPPAISIGQRNSVKNSRSTVGTMTALNEYMKIIYARLAQGRDEMGRIVRPQSPQRVADLLLATVVKDAREVSDELREAVITDSSEASTEWSSASSSGLPTPSPTPLLGEFSSESSYLDKDCLICFELKPVGSFEEMVESLEGQGYLRVLVGTDVLRLRDATESQLGMGSWMMIQDRVKIIEENRQRLMEAIESAMNLGNHQARVFFADAAARPLRWTDGRSFRGDWFPLLEPRAGLFSGNSPLGACPNCKGYGRSVTYDYSRGILPEKSIAEGALKVLSSATLSACYEDMIAINRKRKILNIKTTWTKLSDAQRAWVIDGDAAMAEQDIDPWSAVAQGLWYGLKGIFADMEKHAHKMSVRIFLAHYRVYSICASCHGGRLRPEALAFTIGAKTIPDVQAMPMDDLLLWLDAEVLPFVGGDRSLYQAVMECRSRVAYLCEVGLSYIAANRLTRTLSGGEIERVSLTACLGAALTETLFVLDEPTVGLHARDTDRLICAMRRLVDRGNTLVVVEHEEAVMRSADYLLDLGPASGSAGGELVFAGSAADLAAASAEQCAQSPTLQFLSGAREIAPPKKRRKVKKSLRLRGVNCHNLHDLDVDIPLGVYVCLTGVSGSGKSTLARDVLYGHLHPEKLDDEHEGALRSMEGLAEIDDVLLVDQSPIVRTPRSTPVVYMGIFEDIRALYAALPVSQARGLKAGYFSFNSGEGRCPRCAGLGQEKVEMQFLSDIYVPCAICNGARYTPQALAIELFGLNVADLLALDIRQAQLLFSKELGTRPRRVVQGLQILLDLGLGHLGLGQALNTLSGGENQRLKLARLLVGAFSSEKKKATAAKSSEPKLSASTLSSAKPAKGTKAMKAMKAIKGAKGMLLILDEPGTGLHFQDLEVLLSVFSRLVERGHSLLVIEHNMELIKCADYVIDLGPEGGREGGEIVACGTPEQVAAQQGGYTAHYLAEALGMESFANFTRPSLSLHEEDIPKNCIALRGARHHHLKNIDVDIPLHEMTVVTGLSGSGKSTLAFDIIFAEGQKRFMEVMSPYARQFTAQMESPDMDRLTGLPPTVAIEQNRTRGGSKSTVGTVTEIWQFLRLLYAKLGQPYCPCCDVPLGRRLPEEIFALIKERIDTMSRAGGTLYLAAPVVRNRKGHYADLARWAEKKKFPLLRADGVLVAPADFVPLDRYANHDVDIVMAKLDISRNRILMNGEECDLATLQECLSRALQMGEGFIRVLWENVEASADVDSLGALGKSTQVAKLKKSRNLKTPTKSGISHPARMQEQLLSLQLSCPSCELSYEEPEPASFSFNSPRGWCLACLGHGRLSKLRIKEEDAKNSLLEAELKYDRAVERAAAKEESSEPCPQCHGDRLNAFALHVKLFGKNIARVGELDALQALDLLKDWNFEGREEKIAHNVMLEIRQRLHFLMRVGLGYLALNRPATTLSGGESQRIRLAAQLGSELRGVLYVLDEPTIGLHPKDNERLLSTLDDLKARGNTLLVVEHDVETMRRADKIIDLGPAAGIHGGEIIAQGSLQEVAANPRSITGSVLSQHLKHPYAGKYLSLKNAEWMELKSCVYHNLKHVHLRVPIARFTVVTGPSGAGKSSLIIGTLGAAVQDVLGTKINAETRRRWKTAQGLGSIRALYRVDQSPIGKTPRSTPATYMGIFNEIRMLFSLTPHARRLGFGANRFSFNTTAGHCEHCKGAGMQKQEMDFLPPCSVPCESCRGARYNSRTLQVRYKGKNIAEVLQMSMEEAADFFDGQARLSNPLRLLCETGLSYLTLGQASNTLSGGEAQRIKLVTELIKGRRAALTAIKKGRELPQDLYLIEEPTIGLHPKDVRLLIDVLKKLVEMGNTVLVIEHNMELICEADYIIDMGPGAGDAGGRIVAEGTVKQVAASKKSVTAPFIKDELNK